MTREAYDVNGHLLGSKGPTDSLCHKRFFISSYTEVNLMRYPEYKTKAVDRGKPAVRSTLQEYSHRYHQKVRILYSSQSVRFLSLLEKFCAEGC